MTKAWHICSFQANVQNSRARVIKDLRLLQGLHDYEYLKKINAVIQLFMDCLRAADTAKCHLHYFLSLNNLFVHSAITPSPLSALFHTSCSPNRSTSQPLPTHLATFSADLFTKGTNAKVENWYWLIQINLFFSAIFFNLPLVCLLAAFLCIDLTVIPLNST